MSLNMSNLNTNFDDYDSYLNLDNDFTSQSTSPAIKSGLMLTPQSSSAHTFASSSTPQSFPQPSFDYTSHHQQTGFTSGALANTIAVNKASGLQYYEGNGGFIMPTETLNIPLSNLDEFDFARPDMDFETESPMLFADNSSVQTQFVSPTTLLAQNNSVPQRIYPGMHSQQAAQAKAQQAQKQQMALQQHPARPEGQKPLPSPVKTQAIKDPLIEESISKVLSRMRQASVSSSDKDMDTSLGGMSHMARIKKDEDEMDEDERLLASEEGKKLSSKERRQLRNKVSARAFRSRRKGKPPPPQNTCTLPQSDRTDCFLEYIGQLEGEVAVKAQEANELRQQNEQLREENNRLTDLTRMLLSSQAFSGFLQEPSQSGLPANNGQNNTSKSKQPRTRPQVQTQSQPQPHLKDVSSHEASQQMHFQQPQIGMTLIPEVPVDLSAMQTSNAWMTALPSSDFKVFAVTELPQAPVLDVESLSGKSKSSFGLSKLTKDVPNLPQINKMLASPGLAEQKEELIDDSVVLDSSAFALYFSTPSTSSSACETSSLDAVTPLSEQEQLAELEKRCIDLDESCARIAEYTINLQ